ncbi:AAA family ATPase [Natranaerofaba carboxydovora]|uniref:AAA family ATPase n=1 Tax=Natranaerofaba carboxydovora TaxID=2742683 RepID=UPI001F132F38|nr:AAA family ATPase [Natranaerofaba carboxydovora]UMZ73474.1 ATP-dependent zinc metalloprotease FtsH [Natranaerofaba carboxydovora]
MLIELSLGVSIAILIGLALIGVNVAPVIFVLVVVGVLYFVVFPMKSKTTNSFVNILSGGKEDVVPKVQFEEIGGQDTAINELREALEFVKRPEEIKSMGIRPLKGILLEGPSGTGKTLLAKAASNYTDSVFIPASGSDFIEMYAGVGAKRIRDLFKKAKKEATKLNKTSAIIFIDELDILGAKRGSNSSHMEYDQTLNQLLVEMDGLKISEQVQILVIAATNRPEILDDALLRPGRFDRRVRVDLPDRQGRLEIMKLHCKDKPIKEEFDFDLIAQETIGFSGAHLENVSNEAAIKALRENKEVITERDFSDAIEKVIMGEKLERKPGKNDYERISVHEIGHALISEVVTPGSVAKVTITSRGKALGYTRHNPVEESLLRTQNSLKNQLAVLVAGSMAEEMLLGEKSTGSMDDFQKAAQLATEMIKAGMSTLGIVRFESLTKDQVDKAIREIIKEQQERVTDILKNKSEKLEYLVEKLKEDEQLTGEELREALGVG